MSSAIRRRLYVATAFLAIVGLGGCGSAPDADEVIEVSHELLDSSQ